MKLGKRKVQLLWWCLGIGFGVGIIFENIVAKGQGVSLKIFQPYFLKKYDETIIVKEEFLWYISRVRILPFVILCLLGYFRWKKAVAILYVIWTGFLGGMYVVAAVVSLGMKGIMLCFSGVFPHFLFYGIAYSVLLVNLYSYPQNKWNGSKTIITVLMMMVGILLEAYLNPYLLKWIIKLI